MNVKYFRTNDTIFITSLDGKFGCDVEYEDGKYVCYPIGCADHMIRTYDDKIDALNFAENWCSII